MSPIGDYDVRSIGKLGISNPRAFAVGRYAGGQRNRAE